MELNKHLVMKLKEKNLTISCCESFTGGLFSNFITDVPGASEVFSGSFISYSESFKTNIVKVSKRVIKKYGVISKECSVEMAIKTNKKTKTDISVSFTGNAGPNALENKPKGLAYISIYFLGEVETVEINNSNLSREEFKMKAVNFAIQNIINKI